MKLKTFETVRTSTVTEYVVFQGDTPVDSFTVDYCAKKADGEYDFERTNKAILTRMKYENAGARVRYVSVNPVRGALSVTVEI